MRKDVAVLYGKSTQGRLEAIFDLRGFSEYPDWALCVHPCCPEGKNELVHEAVEAINRGEDIAWAPVPLVLSLLLDGAS